MPASNSFKAIGLKIASIFLFVILASLIKHLGQDYPAGELAFLRAFLGLGPVLAFYAWRGELAGVWRTQRIGGHILRGSIAVSGTFFFIGAYARLPMVDVTAIGLLAPLIMVVFAAWFLKERVHVYRWSAVGIGFVGALLMLFPYLGLTMHAVTSTMMIGVLLAFLNAVCAAGASTQIRRLSETESTASIVVYFSLFVALAGLATLPFGWRVPQTQEELLLLIVLGLIGGFGQIFHTASYRFASPSLLAPFDYTAMIWAFVIGYFFFGELPTLYLIGGALIVSGAGLFVIWRERQLGLKRLRESAFAQAPAEEATADDAAATESKPNELVKTP